MCMFKKFLASMGIGTVKVGEIYGARLTISKLLGDITYSGAKEWEAIIDDILQKLCPLSILTKLTCDPPIHNGGSNSLTLSAKS